MYSNLPKMAAEWERHTPKGMPLPQKLHPDKKVSSKGPKEKTRTLRKR
jgi:hypothetical protein